MSSHVDIEAMRKRLKLEQKGSTEQLEAERKRTEPAEAANPDNTEMAYDYDYRGRHESVIGQLEARLAEINHALERIDQGAYGMCTNCGQPVQAERLQALPQAERCIDCERETGSGPVA